MTTTATGPTAIPMRMNTWQAILYLGLSVTILVVYLGMNVRFYPGYPVITDYAEQSPAYSATYPPFRMNEWLFYSITDDIITNRTRSPESLAAQHPLGYSLIAVPLTRMFGEIGMYYTNAAILWVSALLFFYLAHMTVGFGMAYLMTAILAFGTPNLFFAASAYGEPLSQLLLLGAATSWLAARRHPGQRSWFDLLCGLACGLQVFTVPMLMLTIVVPLFDAVRSGSGAVSRLKWLGAGVLGAFAVYGAISAAMLHRVTLGVFSFHAYLSMFGTESLYYSGQNPIVSLLKLLFDSPHGILFVMPVSMLTPLGLLVMWRRGERMLAPGMLAVILIVLVSSSLCGCPISGEVVGTRQLAPLIPFFLLPLAFLKYLNRGEQVWLTIAMLFTVYQCSFGWWLGTARGEGTFVGILHDRAGSSILLARKGMLERPQYHSTGDIRAAFVQSLARHDIDQWLTTLDRESLRTIEGFERIVFARLIEETVNGAERTDSYIDTTDPDHGVRLIIPDILAPQPLLGDMLPAE